MLATVSLPQQIVGGRRDGAWIAWDAAKKGARAKATMSDEDFKDPAVTYTLFLEVSFDGGNTVGGANSIPCVGNPGLDPAGNIIVPAVAKSFTAAEVKPSHVRGSVSVSGNQSIGTAVEFFS